MPVPGIDIREKPIATQVAPTRADIALFVGLVARRPGSLPAEIAEWINASDYGRTGSLLKRSPEMLGGLLDVPVPVESWDMFDALFAWDERPMAANSPEQVPSRMGLAVRSFFEEGGAKAYIVRTGDPAPVLTDEEDRTLAIEGFRKLLSWTAGGKPVDADLRVPIISGHANRGNPADIHDPATWSGTAHIFGLEDVAFLLLPDLAELISGPARIAPVNHVPDEVQEQFIDCAPILPGVQLNDRPARDRLIAPRLDSQGYAEWGRAINYILEMLHGRGGAANRRDVMLVGSMPLPDDSLETGAGENILARLHGSGASSARLQLAWPWVVTPASTGQAEAVEGGEGLLAGALARAALTEGAHAPATGRLRSELLTTTPQLSTDDLVMQHETSSSDWLGSTLSLIGRKTDRFSLLSDATSSIDPNWQAGAVSRLIASLLRNARQLGLTYFFENSGPDTWAQLTSAFDGLLRRFWDAGALGGLSPQDAWRVRCDRSTMTQSDIDNGRLIAEIELRPAQLIERIKVALTLSDGKTK